jgi:LPXTG-site transpeptidase (sortase) family protein
MKLWSKKLLLKEKIKIFWKPFVLSFLLAFLVINWIDVSWVFNYKVISGISSDFFQKDNLEAVSNEPVSNEPVSNSFEEDKTELIKKEESNNSEVLSKANEEQNKSSQDSGLPEKKNILEIPKIGISAPLVFVENADEEDLYKALDSGVVYFPGSVLPGQTGQTIFLGHSAPAGWPKIKYDWVFSEINELTKGDEILIYFNYQKYSYSVTRKIFLDKGEEIPSGLTNSNNMLVLISCWPPGKDLRRIAVEAELANKSK